MEINSNRIPEKHLEFWEKSWKTRQNSRKKSMNSRKNPRILRKIWEFQEKIPVKQEEFQEKIREFREKSRNSGKIQEFRWEAVSASKGKVLVEPRKEFPTEKFHGKTCEWSNPSPQNSQGQEILGIDPKESSQDGFWDASRAKGTIGKFGNFRGFQGIVELWDCGIPESGNSGILGSWNCGISGSWKFEILEFWDQRILGSWHFGVMEFQNRGIPQSKSY